MRAVVLAAVAALFCAGSTGCATIMTGAGPNQTVRIASNPRGAKIFVDGDYKGVTPLGVQMTRSDNHVLRLEMDGYAPMTRDIRTGYNPWHLGNILFGGLVGITIDLLDGSFLWLGGGINERLARIQPGEGITESTALASSRAPATPAAARVNKAPPRPVARPAPLVRDTSSAEAAPVSKSAAAGTYRPAPSYGGEPSLLPPRRQAAPARQ